jgi:hypothetical protein
MIGLFSFMELIKNFKKVLVQLIEIFTWNKLKKRICTLQSFLHCLGV